jgi:16S rRNA processing protein RimM
MQSETEWATIGKIVAPFGLRGELKVFSLSDIPNRFATLKKVYLGAEHSAHIIKSARPYKGDMVILKLSAIDDATMAEQVRGQDICIAVDALAPLPPDSYYQHDILGLHVVTLDGRDVGVISDIMLTGGNDVYSVKMADGREVLIPAVKDVVKQVDLSHHMMYIDPIKGLLDDDAVIDRDDSAVSAAEEEVEA